jgi:hypothetical protein
VTLRGSPRLEPFSRWLAEFGDAWEAADADAMADLFTVGATLQRTPFTELLHGRRQIRDYLAELLAGSREIHFRAQVLGAGDTYGVAHWRTSYRLAMEEVEPVERVRDGILICALDDRGRCTSLRQWWHETEESLPGPVVATDEGQVV